MKLLIKNEILRMKKSGYFILFIFIMQGVFAQSLSFQGVLRDPMMRTVESGEYNLTVKLYDTAVDGEVLWSELHENVPVKHGVFAIELGAMSGLDGVSFDTQYYLGVAVDDANEIFPRFKLNTVTNAISVKGKENIFPSNGNVGVGTLSPDAKLTISSDESVSVSVNTNSTGTAGFSLSAGGEEWNIDNNTDNHLNFSHSDSGQVLTMSPAGNVGVGVSEPNVSLHIGGDTDEMSLHVGGNIKISNDKGLYSEADKFIGSSGNDFVIENNGNSGLTVTADGKVGIGILTPSEALEVNGDIKFSSGGSLFFSDGTSLATTDVGGSSNFMTNADDAILTADDDADGNGHIQVLTGSNNTFTVANNGNIGLGTDNPIHKLDITGNINFSGQMLNNNQPFVASPWTQSGNDIYLGAGNVAINSTDYTHGLNVGGTINATDVQNANGSLLPRDWVVWTNSGFAYPASDDMGGNRLFFAKEGTTDSRINELFNLTVPGYDFGYDIIVGAETGESAYLAVNGEQQYSYRPGVQIGHTGNYPTIKIDGGTWYSDYFNQNYLFAWNFYSNWLWFDQSQQLSDYRVKKNIRTILGGLDKLRLIEGVQYDINIDTHPRFKRGQLKDNDKTTDIYGFIAQDLKEVIPEMVEYQDQYDLYAIRNYEQLYPILVESLKELKAKNDALKEQVKIVDAELAKLEKMDK